MKLNKLLAMSAVVACGLTLGACGGDKKSDTTSTTPAAEKVNVGVGYNASFDASKSQVDVTAAFAAFGADGTIKAARIDVVQVKVKAVEVEYTENDEAKKGFGLALNLDEAHLNSDGSVKTKLELGSVYNMKRVSKLQKEVDEQIENYSKWAVGKKVSELASKADDQALTSGVSIHTTDFSAALAKAYELKSSASYDLAADAKAGVGMVAKVAYNYGKPSSEVSVDFGGALVSNGKIAAASLDAVVASFTISEDGSEVSLNTAAKYFAVDGENVTWKSKKTLGDAYAMRNASPIKKEWFEQIAALETFAVGKTAAEIGAATKEALTTAGTSITATAYTASLKKAAEYAVVEHVGPQA